LGVAARLVIGKSEIQQYLRVVGLDCQRLAVLRDGFVELAFVGERGPIIRKAVDRLRMCRQIFAIERKGCADVA